MGNAVRIASSHVPAARIEVGKMGTLGSPGVPEWKVEHPSSLRILDRGDANSRTYIIIKSFLSLGALCFSVRSLFEALRTMSGAAIDSHSCYQDLVSARPTLTQKCVYSLGNLVENTEADLVEQCSRKANTFNRFIKREKILAELCPFKDTFDSIKVWGVLLLWTPLFG